MPVGLVGGNTSTYRRPASSLDPEPQFRDVPKSRFERPMDASRWTFLRWYQRQLVTPGVDRNNYVETCRRGARLHRRFSHGTWALWLCGAYYRAAARRSGLCAYPLLDWRQRKIPVWRWLRLSRNPWR